MKKKLVGAGVTACFAIILAFACMGNPGGGRAGQMETGKTEAAAEPGTEGQGEGTVSGTGGEKEELASEAAAETEADGKKDEEEKKAAEGEGSKKELSHAPEVTFQDYSREIRDEGSGVFLLAVTENRPIISIPEDEAVAERMNLVFEQQHTVNQEGIEQAAEIAKSDYDDMSEEEKKGFGGYSYGMSYKMTYASTKILSIQAECFEWRGDSQVNVWSSAYCFDCASGDLLYLSDIFSDVKAARKIVERHILDTVSSKEYKEGLLDDYESYIPDVLTENVFYLDGNGLAVLCNPGLVTSYEMGVIKIEVPYGELEEVMEKQYLPK